mmetsp:Transcript_17642/g.55032  ORF Transcript_17642/g.55032 Transcript_17642/m.55032 type:complete len:396 (-) Transcript_17642:490-1677(-)
MRRRMRRHCLLQAADVRLPRFAVKHKHLLLGDSAGGHRRGADPAVHAAGPVGVCERRLRRRQREHLDAHRLGVVRPVRGRPVRGHVGGLPHLLLARGALLGAAAALVLQVRVLRPRPPRLLGCQADRPRRDISRNALYTERRLCVLCLGGALHRARLPALPAGLVCGRRLHDQRTPRRPRRGVAAAAPALLRKRVGRGVEGAQPAPLPLPLLGPPRGHGRDVLLLPASGLPLQPLRHHVDPRHVPPQHGPLRLKRRPARRPPHLRLRLRLLHLGLLRRPHRDAVRRLQPFRRHGGRRHDCRLARDRDRHRRVPHLHGGAARGAARERQGARCGGRRWRRGRCGECVRRRRGGGRGRGERPPPRGAAAVVRRLLRGDGPHLGLHCDAPHKLGDRAL